MRTENMMGYRQGWHKCSWCWTRLIRLLFYTCIVSTLFTIVWQAYPSSEPHQAQLWLRDVNDRSLDKLLRGIDRVDHNSRPCQVDDSRQKGQRKTSQRAERDGRVDNELRDGRGIGTNVGVSGRTQNVQHTDDCHDLHKQLTPACPDCTEFNEKKLRDAHPSIFQQTKGVVSCLTLFRGDEKAIAAARLYMKSHEHVVRTAQYYIYATRNCAAFRKMRGYFNKPLSQEEAEFPIAFSILMYRDVEQVERLLRAIYMPQNYYCIHIDTKADPAVIAAMRSITRCFDNVFLASRLESVYWGHISIMYAEMSCMHDIVHMSGTWKYFINLSGQMFPAHSNAELVRILQLFDGANDVEGSFKRSDHFFYLLRNKVSWRLSTTMQSMLPTFYPKSSAPYNVTLYKGSNQVVLSRAFVLYFLYHPISQNLVEWFADTLAPDEYIWPTINHNKHLYAPGSYKGDPETKTYTARASIWTEYSFQAEWSWHDWKCHGKWVHGICIFGVGDLPWMYRRPELFINKLHIDFEWLTYGCIEELIFNKTMEVTTSTFDLSYYLELPFMNNKTLVTSVNETLQFLCRSDYV